MGCLKGSKNLLILQSFLKNPNSPKTICLEGSMRSGKSISIEQTILMEAAKGQDYVARCFRRDGTVAKKSLKPDFFMLLKSQLPELWSRDCWNDRDACYTMPVGGENAGKIFLAGTNDPETLKGQTQVDAFINECTETSLEAKRQIEGRTKRYKFYDWNPSLTDHWIFTDVLGQDPTKYCYIHSTYKDNPYLTQEIIESIEKWEPTPDNIRAGTASNWHWQVYGLGKRARREGAVYTNWQITDKWPDRMACTRWGYGLDFGFSIDPTALLELAYFQDNLYIREIVYETGLINLKRVNMPNIRSLEGLLEENEIDKDAVIRADSAHPDLISELGVAGYRVIGFNKSQGGAKGYVLSGINRCQQQNIRVHRSSYNVIKEFENYTWKRDINDVQLNEPIGDFNHAMDAMRGWVMDEIKPKRIEPKNYNRETNKRPMDPFYGIRKVNHRKVLQRQRGGYI